MENTEIGLYLQLKLLFLIKAFPPCFTLLVFIKWKTNYISNKNLYNKES